MNITLYPLGAYVSGYCLPFTIELDGMDQADYGQAVSKGLFAQAAEAQVALIAIASPKRTARFDKEVKLVIISPF